MPPAREANNWTKVQEECRAKKAASVSRSRNQRDREATANHVATGRKDVLLVLITR